MIFFTRLSTRIKIFLIIATIGSFGIGIIDLGDAMQYHSPERLTYAQIVARQPDAGWFSVTGGYLDLTQSILPPDIAERAYFVPLRVVGMDVSRLDIEVYITNPDLVNRIDAYNDKSNRTMTAYGMTHLTEVRAYQSATEITMPVSGMISQIAAPGTKDFEKIESSLDTEQMFFTIDEGKRPSILPAIGALGLGALMSVGLLWACGMDPAELLNHILGRPGGSGSGVGDAYGGRATGRRYRGAPAHYAQPYQPPDAQLGQYPRPNPFPLAFPPQDPTGAPKTSVPRERPTTVTPAQWPYGIPGAAPRQPATANNASTPTTGEPQNGESTS